MTTENEDETQNGSKPKKKESMGSYEYDNRSDGSYLRDDARYVFVETNRDVLMEIGYAEDKLRLIERMRMIEWDPTFWSLNDEIVDWFNKDDKAATLEKIELLERSIADKEARLIEVRKELRMMNRERGVFSAALEFFPDLVKPPNEDEESIDLNEMAVSICQLIKEVEKTMVKNLESESKLASLDEQIGNLREDLRGFEERNKSFDVNAHLMAVETQNSMLNELLTSIIEKIKETAQDMENLKSSDPKVLVKIIKEASDLSFTTIGDCFPHMQSKPGLSQLLWLPHDHKFMSFDKYIKMVKPVEHPLDIVIDWKERKRRTKDIEETSNQIRRVKRKVALLDKRKASGYYGRIMYVTDEGILSNSYGPITERDF